MVVAAAASQLLRHSREHDPDIPRITKKRPIALLDVMGLTDTNTCIGSKTKLKSLKTNIQTNTKKVIKSCVNAEKYP